MPLEEVRGVGDKEEVVVMEVKMVEVREGEDLEAV